MKFAYADPPYYGCCGLYDHHHPDGKCWDDWETHQMLTYRLMDEYPDGWAVSMTSGNLIDLVLHLPLPPGTRVAAWVKPFASFKPNVNPAYTWEPVIFYGGRKRDRDQPTIKDHLAQVITLQKGLTGAKPEPFCRWILDLLGWLPGDDLVDLFPGTFVMDRTVTAAKAELPLWTQSEVTA